MTRMSRCTVLLKNVWLSGCHNFHPRLHYIHQNAQRLPWVIRNQLYQRLQRSSRCSFEWLFLAGILEPSLDCSKAILPQRHKRCLGYLKNRIISVAERSERRSSMIAILRLYSALQIVAILRIWLFTRSIRLSQTPTTISGRGTI